MGDKTLSIIKEKFIHKNIDIYKMSNTNGMTVEITNFGGIVLSLYVPDRNGNFEDVVLGYDKLEPYFVNSRFFGAIIGRHANRIEDSSFEINGVKYELDKNEGKNHLHGGSKGFHKVVWDAEIVKDNNTDCLKLTYLSKDGEDNYPGNLKVTVTYTLTEDNSLRIDYSAVSDRDTVINLTNHAYFNLAGHESGDILNHELKIYADKFTPIDEESIPTGEIREVKGTPMDFTAMKPIGIGICSDYEQIIKGEGFDHNWVLNISGSKPEKAAELFEPLSGRFMEVYTTKPGIQFYSGNKIAHSEVGKDGVMYKNRSGLCLETQYFPNSLKHKHFPSPIFTAGMEYKHTTIYKFKSI